MIKFKHTKKEDILIWWEKTLSEENRNAFCKHYNKSCSFEDVKFMFSQDCTKEPSYLTN